MSCENGRFPSLVSSRALLTFPLAEQDFSKPVLPREIGGLESWPFFPGMGAPRVSTGGRERRRPGNGALTPVWASRAAKGFLVQASPSIFIQNLMLEREE